MLSQYIETAALVTGIIYMVLQILQNRYMWYADMVSAACTIFTAASNRIWATAMLNVYFVVMSVVGIIKWKKFSKQTDGGIHIVRMKTSSLIISAFILVFGGAGVCFILNGTGDPAPLLDAAVLILSAVASWWLAESYIEQWYLWLAADIIGLVLFLSQGVLGISLLYACYIISSVIGYINWRKKGICI